MPPDLRPAVRAAAPSASRPVFVSLRPSSLCARSIRKRAAPNVAPRQPQRFLRSQPGVGQDRHKYCVTELVGREQLVAHAFDDHRRRRCDCALALGARLAHPDHGPWMRHHSGANSATVWRPASICASWPRALAARATYSGGHDRGACGSRRQPRPNAPDSPALCIASPCVPRLAGSFLPERAHQEGPTPRCDPALSQLVPSRSSLAHFEPFQ
jgi:hypothetical protein